jgi:hypothetical protein
VISRFLSFFLPSQLEPYASIIALVLLFVDGAIFGLAIKKGFLSIILIIVGLLLASYVGLSIPFLSTNNIASHLIGIALSQISHMSPIFFSFPILWIVGLGIGIWKG